MPLTFSSYIGKFLYIWGFFILISLIFSFLFVFLGDNIFREFKQKENVNYIPFYNLLILLDIVKMPRIYFVLLFLPILNIICICMIMYRLSIVYRTSRAFSIGLILLPVIFVPILNFKDLFKKEEKVIEEENNRDIILLTQEELDKLNSNNEEIPKVDSVFKLPKLEVEDIPVFKANQNNIIDIKKQSVVQNEESNKYMIDPYTGQLIEIVEL